MNNLIVALYDIFAISAALMLVYVGVQAMNDLHLSRTDRPWLKNYRKMSFFADASFQFLTVCFQRYWLIDPTTVSVGIVVIMQILFGGAILVASIVSMRERAPPQDGHRVQMPSGLVHIRSKLTSFFIRH